MTTSYFLCSILMHFFSGVAITYLYSGFRGAVKHSHVQEERIIALNKDNAKLQQAYKAKQKILRRKV